MLYISNIPFVPWLSVFGIRGEANILGIIERTTVALLVAGSAGSVSPALSAFGSLMGIVTFVITRLFFFVSVWFSSRPHFQEGQFRLAPHDGARKA